MDTLTQKMDSKIEKMESHLKKLYEHVYNLDTKMEIILVFLSTQQYSKL